MGTHGKTPCSGLSQRPNRRFVSPLCRRRATPWRRAASSACSAVPTTWKMPSQTSYPTCTFLAKTAADTPLQVAPRQVVQLSMTMASSCTPTMRPTPVAVRVSTRSIWCVSTCSASWMVTWLKEPRLLPTPVTRLCVSGHLSCPRSRSKWLQSVLLTQTTTSLT